MQDKLEQKIKFFDLLSFVALQPVFIVIFWYIISYIVWAALLAIYIVISSICAYLFDIHDILLKYMNDWSFSMTIARAIALALYLNFLYERFEKIKDIKVIVSNSSLRFSIFTAAVCALFTIFAFLSFRASKYNMEYFIVTTISFIIFAYCFKKRGLDC